MHTVSSLTLAARAAAAPVAPTAAPTEPTPVVPAALAAARTELPPPTRRAPDAAGQAARRTAFASAEAQTAARLGAAGAAPPAPNAPGRADVEAGRAVLQRGHSGAAVVELQERLTRVGFGVQATGTFGPTTAGVVAAFQAAHGVQQTGQVGRTTLQALDGAELPAIRAGRLSLGAGASGGAVRHVQERLTAAGFGVQATGVLGPTTQGVLSEFQRARGLPPSGDVDAATLVALEGNTGTGTSVPTPRIDQNKLPHPRSWAFCGVASTMMVLRSQGQSSPATRANLDQLATEMYLPGQGTSGAAMARSLSQRGVPSRYTTTGSSADVVAGIQAGRPVPLGVIDFGGKVQTLDAASARYPGLRAGQSYEHTYGASGHWVTVTGFEGPAQNPTHFIANDPDTGATVRLSRAQLERHAGGAGAMWMVTSP